MKTLLTILLICFASVANANQTLLGYVNWLTQNSNFEYEGQPLPSIKVISKNAIQVLAYTQETIDSLKAKGQEPTPIVALYDDTTDTIIVNEDFDIMNFEYHHILVHELVHYLQDINGITDDCIQNLESIAYELQEKWMDEVDHPADRPNALFVALIAAHCDGHFLF